MADSRRDAVNGYDGAPGDIDEAEEEGVTGIQVMQPRKLPGEKPAAPPVEVIYEEDEDEEALRTFISNIADIEQELIAIPQWGRKIIVRAMTAEQRYGLFQTHTDTKTGIANMQLIYADMLIKSCFHPKTMKPIFKIADRKMLLSKNSAAIDTLATAAGRLSGMSEEVQEVLAKN